MGGLRYCKYCQELEAAPAAGAQVLYILSRTGGGSGWEGSGTANTVKNWRRLRVGGLRYCKYCHELEAALAADPQVL